MPWFRWDGNDLILRLRVTARAGGDGFAGIANDCLKVHIAAAPVQGRANAHLIDFLARQFGTPKTRITLLQGHSGRTKILRLAAPARTPPELGIPGHRRQQRQSGTTSARRSANRG
jgi:uncharacterized protein